MSIAANSTGWVSTVAAPRWVSTLAAVAGLIVLGLTFAFGRLPAVKQAGACWTQDAVFLFEFATSQAELDRIFGEEDSRCRTLNLAAMDAANTLDVFAYIPAYTAFTCLAALLLGASSRRLRTAALTLALLAAAADYVETTTLLSMTERLEAAAVAQMWTAATAAWIKFGSLAMHALVLGVACCFAPRRRILGVLLTAPMIGFTCMALDFDLHPLLKIGFFVGWTAILIASAAYAVAPRLASAR